MKLYLILSIFFNHRLFPLTVRKAHTQTGGKKQSSLNLSIGEHVNSSNADV